MGNSCAWCGEKRFLPIELGSEFVCWDVGLECREDSANRPTGKLVANACAFCGCERHLPFDFGEEFTCDMAGFDCDYTSEAAHAKLGIEEEKDKAPEMFSHICSRCGTQR